MVRMFGLLLIMAGIALVIKTIMGPSGTLFSVIFALVATALLAIGSASGEQPKKG